MSDTETVPLLSAPDRDGRWRMHWTAEDGTRKCRAAIVRGERVFCPATLERGWRSLAWYARRRPSWEWLGLLEGKTEREGL